MKRTLTLLLALAVLSVSGHAREVHIALLHTCDLHGNVLPTESYEGRTNLGGIARCATVIRQVRAEQPNTLLLDAGDTIQGAAISYLTGGQAMVKVLNLLRYDAWCWGNHEFDWGLEKLAACAKTAEMPILNANLHGSAAILKRVTPFVIREVDGVKIGIIGLNTPGIPNWSRPRLIPGLDFADSIETLKPIVPALQRAGARVLVLVCHQGYREGGDDHANQVNAIARTFPELDVIIGGHTHRNFPEYKIGNVLYCQAGYHGIHLGRVDLMFDTNAGRVTRRESNTLLMDGRIPLDQSVLDACAEDIDRVQKMKAIVIGRATEEFVTRGAPKHETAIHNLLFESISGAFRKQGVTVDAVVHGIFEERGALQRGAITIGDVWKIVPYENTIGVLRLTPGELKEVLDENAAAYERREFRGIGGVCWTFDPTGGESNRVIAVTRRDGSWLPEDRRLAVAFNSYELASGGLRWKRLRELADKPETELVEYDVQIRQAVIDYIQQRGEISPTIRGWWKAQPRLPTVTRPGPAR